MKLCFIGSGVEREDTRLAGIEISAVANVLRRKFSTLIFGGSSVGLMEAFATAFVTCGGDVVSIVPRWLQNEDLVFVGADPIWCDDLAERKTLLFDGADAVLCYPGGLGTWDELFDLLARSAVGQDTRPRTIYLYNWEKFYAPLLLQMETALELGLIRSESLAMIRPFESVQELQTLLEVSDDGNGPA